MEIELIRREELLEYAGNATRLFESDIPITVPRAKSQALNPDASKEDVLLIVAREGKKLLSFMGIYPSKVQNNPSKRIFWISCWWKASGVNSEVSHLILKKFLEITGMEVGVPHLPPHIIKVLEKNSLLIKGREGMMVRFRSALHSRSLQLSIKGKVHSLISIVRSLGILRMIDFTSALIKPSRIIKDTGPMHPGFRVFFEVPGDEYFSFIEKNFAGYITIPARTDIEWIINNPWLVSPEEANREVIKRYHFSYVAEDLHHFFPVMEIDGEKKGAGFFSARDGAVKSLFIFVKDEYRNEFLRNLSLFIQKEKKYHTLVSYEKTYVNYLTLKLDAGSKITKLKRYVAIGNPAWKELNPTDGDGDSCFT